MATPAEILENALRETRQSIDIPIIADSGILDRVKDVARCPSNRAGVRMLMTCTLAKIHRPEVDIRKPYTEIGDSDSYSGRAEYDESYVWPFASREGLPINSTTAFLTPGFRTINVPLAAPLTISGRPKRMYEDTIQLLDDVHQGRVSANDLLAEVIRQLLLLKREQEGRLRELIEELGRVDGSIPLSSEEIVSVIEQHLRSQKSSRLPVLIIAAAYSVLHQDGLGKERGHCRRTMRLTCRRVLLGTWRLPWSVTMTL